MDLHRKALRLFRSLLRRTMPRISHDYPPARREIPLRRQRKVKILATLGPPPHQGDDAAVRGGRGRVPHQYEPPSHDRMRELITTIREVDRISAGRSAFFADLQGPKLRIGEFEGGGVELENGARFTHRFRSTARDATRVYLPIRILAAIEPGHTLLLDDGKVRLKALECSPTHALTEVVVGGRMSNRKGVSLPDTEIPVSP